MPNLSVQVVHRGKVRAFFSSATEAESHRFEFDPRDICEVTGYVNRFSGIRSPAKEFWQRIANGDDPQASTLRVSPEDIANCAGAFEAALARAHVVVTAFGYKTNLPDIVASVENNWGGRGKRYYPLDWCIAKDGQVSVSNTSGQVAVWHPLQRSFSGALNPTYLASVYGIGLGYGVVDEVNGGVRLDGMNLYHNAVGSMILDGLRPFDGLVPDQTTDSLAMLLLWRSAAEGIVLPRETLRSRLSRLFDQHQEGGALHQQAMRDVLTELSVRLHTDELMALKATLTSQRGPEAELTKTDLLRLADVGSSCREEDQEKVDDVELSTKSTLRPVFTLLDANGDGAISGSDLRLAAASLGVRGLSDGTIAKMLDMAANGGKGGHVVNCYGRSDDVRLADLQALAGRL